MSHSQPFSYNTFQASADGFQDYFSVTLSQDMGGFAAGSNFHALSVRHDGAVHARDGGDTYYLGKLKTSKARTAMRASSPQRQRDYEYNVSRHRVSSSRAYEAMPSSRYGAYQQCGSSRCGVKKY